MGERVSTFSSPDLSSAPVNDVASGVAPAGPHPLRTGFKRAPKPLSLEEQRAFDAWQEKEATRAAERLHEIYLSKRRAFEQEPGPDRPTLVDIAVAVSDLWQHLHNEPVELTRKATLIAELEPVRKRLQGERIAARIREGLAQEDRIRQIYLRARLFAQHTRAQEHPKTSSHYYFSPLRAQDAEEYTRVIREYLATPSKHLPSQAARAMDAEIRETFAKRPPEAHETRAQWLLFKKTDLVYRTWLSLQHELQKDLDPKERRYVEERMQGTERPLAQALYAEQCGYDTAAMARERRGIVALVGTLKHDPLLASLFERSLVAEESSYPELQLALIQQEYRLLRPGEETLLTHVLRYYREVASPRRQALLEQHRSFLAWKQEEDPQKKDALAQNLDKAAQLLEQETLLEPERKNATLPDVLHQSSILAFRWKQEVENTHVAPLSIESLQLPWRSLEAQYALVIRLIEDTARLNPVSAKDRELQTDCEARLQETLTYMQEVERCYVESLMAYVRIQLTFTESDLWPLEQKDAPKNQELIQKISEELDQIKNFFAVCPQTFSSAPRQQSYHETFERYTQLCRRFEAVNGGSSPQTTVRPPRLAPLPAEVELTDRGRE